jgi:hypothetical protein
MSLENAPLKRLRPAVAILLLLGVGAAHAAEGSFSKSVTNAFDTIVIDATAAASKAKEVLNQKPFEKTKKKKDGAQKEAADKSADKKNAESADKAKDTGKTDTPTESGKKAADPAKDAKSTDKDAKSADKTTTTKDPNPNQKDAPGKGTPADPAAKAADGAAPIDPKTGKPIEAAPKKPVIATEWPASDVELAKARCTQLLKGVDAVTIPEAPFRKGDCGSMAPVRLISIGKNPEVTLSPPPVVSCDLVVGLTKWVKNDVQPLARRHLGAEVIRIESMSDYSCRMAYGRVGNKLSEHGKANALDIRGFITRKGDQAVVLSSWGQTARDIRKQIAAAKAAAEKAEAVKVAAEQANKARAEAAEFAAKSETTGTPLPRKTLVEGLPPKKDANSKLALPASVTKDGPLSATKTRLGGPNEAITKTNDKTGKSASKQKKTKDEVTTTAALPGAEIDVKPPAPQNATSRFLHEAHAAACRTFGTTLGPEANEAHRNHFHVDMAERKVRKICD